MNTTFARFITVLLGCVALGISLCPAEDSPRPISDDRSQSSNQYEPYSFLIGEWDVKADEDGPVAAVIRISWGPNRSYIWYASSLLFDGHEEPHLEGMLVWNA